jgi:hypothetical protein
MKSLGISKTFAADIGVKVFAWGQTPRYLILGLQN